MMIHFLPETQHSRTHIATKAKAKTTEIFIDFSVKLSWIPKRKQEDLIMEGLSFYLRNLTVIFAQVSR